MCYPKSLLNAKDWEVTPMASHVSCTGDHSSTQCKMSCWTNHVPVESSPYLCQKSPCPAWTIGQSGCYRCDYNCTQLHDLMEPQPLSMVEALGCSCDKVVVSARPLKAFPGAAFISNNSQSCPPLVAEYLLTTVGHGQSFEGLVVNLACKGNNMPFPTSVKCR